MKMLKKNLSNRTMRTKVVEIRERSGQLPLASPTTMTIGAMSVKTERHAEQKNATKRNMLTT